MSSNGNPILTPEQTLAAEAVRLITSIQRSPVYREYLESLAKGQRNLAQVTGLLSALNVSEATVAAVAEHIKVTKADEKTQAPVVIKWHENTEDIVIPHNPSFVDRLIYKQAITGVIAKPKMGKTTLLLDAIDAILRGEPFLKLKTDPTNVLYVSEQPLISFAAELRNSGLLPLHKKVPGSNGIEVQGSKLHFATSEAWFGITWSNIINLVGEKAAATASSLVIFDTLSRIARVENENDASEMQEAIDVATPLLKAGIGMVFVQHERKSGGDIYDAGRGTNALTGAVDMLLRLNIPEGKCGANTRKLEFLGRMPGPGNEPLMLNRKTLDETSRYEYLGTALAVKRVDLEQRIIDLYGDDNTLLTISELQSATETPRSPLMRALSNLIEHGALEQIGEGTKGSPYQYRAKTELNF